MMLALLRWHEGPLRYDLRRIQVTVEDILSGRICWNEAWLYINEVLREPASHTCSAIRGDVYVPAAAEMAAWAIFEQEVNLRRAKGVGRIRVRRPWMGHPPSYKQTAPELDEGRRMRREKLAALF